MIFFMISKKIYYVKKICYMKKIYIICFLSKSGPENVCVILS